MNQFAAPGIRDGAAIAAMEGWTRRLNLHRRNPFLAETGIPAGIRGGTGVDSPFLRNPCRPSGGAGPVNATADAWGLPHPDGGIRRRNLSPACLAGESGGLPGLTAPGQPPSEPFNAAECGTWS